MKEIKYECTKYILEKGDLDDGNGIAALAIENYREYNDIYLDYVIENFTDILKMIGFSDIKVYYSGFYSQGDGASFEGDLDVDEITIKNIKEALEYIGEDIELKKLLTDLYKTTCDIQGLKLRITKNGNYQHEMTMDIDVMEYDKNEYKNKEIYHKAGEILTICRYLAKWLYDKLEKSYEYQDSDEYIFQLLVNNEYELNEKGEII